MKPTKHHSAKRTTLGKSQLIMRFLLTMAVSTSAMCHLCCPLSYRDLSSNLKTYSTLNRLPPELKDEMQVHCSTAQYLALCVLVVPPLLAVVYDP
jgi:hypothetical protein